MARSVYDVAVSLGVMTGVDPADPATKKSEGKFHTDYTQFLKVDALKGARIGVARDFTGADPDVDWIFEAALKAMERAGATLIDVRYPKWFLDSSRRAVYTLFPPEFAKQIGDYLKTTAPKYPKSLDKLIERSYEYTSMGKDGAGPNPFRWAFFTERDNAFGTMVDPGYIALRDYYMPMTAALVNGILAKDKLDAIVYPTNMKRPAQIVGPPGVAIPTAASPTVIANLSGFPDLIVPAGFTTDDLPVTISFLGTAFNEPKLLALGYSFEQATHALRRPVHTPALPGGTIDVSAK